MTNLQCLIYWLVNEKIGLCGCGSQGGVADYAIVHGMLSRARHLDTMEGRGSVSFYEAMDAAPAEWVEFGAKVLDSWGLLDHGTGIGHAWLTDNGVAFLLFLDEYGDDSENWPQWVSGLTAGQLEEYEKWRAL